MKKVAKWVLGWIFLILGILGLFLPVLQGILFLFIGAVLLSSTSPRFKRLVDKLARKYPDQYLKVKSIEEKITDFFRRKF